MYINFETVEKRLNAYHKPARHYDDLACNLYDKGDCDEADKMLDFYNRYKLLRLSIKQTVWDLGYKCYYNADEGAWRIENYD